MNSDDYRKCVGIFVLQRASGLVFAAERYNEPGAWQIPQGGVEANENDFDAAVRELREETGITSVKIVASTSKRYRYDFPDYVLKKRCERGWIPFKGQSMKFFLFEFFGDDSEINLQTHPEEIEFSNWAWMNPKSLIENMIGFKKDTIRQGALELRLI